MEYYNEETEEYENYSPNELANMKSENNAKYKKIMNQNFDDDNEIEKYHERNLKWAQECLAQQRHNRRS